MPIGFSDDDTATFSLDYHVTKYPDASKRPTFHVPFMTARNARKALTAARALFAKYDAEADDDKKIDLLIEAAKLYVVRVDNVGTDNIDDALNNLTHQSLNELTDKMLTAARLTEIERGKLGPAVKGDSEKSAPSAVQPAAV